MVNLPKSAADQPAFAAEAGEAVPVVDDQGHPHQGRSQTGVIARHVAVGVEQVGCGSGATPGRGCRKKRSQTQPLSPGRLKSIGGELRRQQIFPIGGEQPGKDPEALRVQPGRGRHQHHLGARGPLRLDDEEDVDLIQGPFLSIIRSGSRSDKVFMRQA